MIPRHKLPSLNALRAFEASGRKLNFRAAAEELNVTQGAVAQQVRMLEEYLGIALFVRLPRGLALTTEGSIYLVNVTRAFDVLAESTAEILNQPKTLTISVTPTVATKILLPNFSELYKTLPHIKLQTMATEHVSNFDQDQVDIAIRLTEHNFSEDLEAQLLFPQELIAVASPFLIKELPEIVTIEQLTSLPLLHDAHNAWPQFLNIHTELAGPVFNQTTLALDAALAGQGIALTCRAFIERDLTAKRLVQIHPKTLILEASYYLVRKKSSQANEDLNVLWQWCLDHLNRAS
ncbi:LysR substrate-binding domain-containing protein [Wohlfahrtiimonas larvae]|uniref:Transcriptional regulator GcvA n=3 Tax=Wohlfahrtiimonas larvae TaxID=1157986 RepID=A0ABP9MIY7_9GAMM